MSKDIHLGHHGIHMYIHLLTYCKANPHKYQYIIYKAHTGGMVQKGGANMLPHLRQAL